MGTAPPEILGSLITVLLAIIGSLILAICILVLMWWRSVIDRIARLEEISENRHHRARTEFMNLNDFDKQLVVTLDLVMEQDKKKLSEAMSTLQAMAKAKRGVVLEEGQEDFDETR